MNYLNFKVSATKQVAYPASAVLSIFNDDATSLKIHLTPRSNDAVGDAKDVIDITCTSGKTMDVAKAIASAVSGASTSNGGIVEVLDLSADATSLTVTPSL
jgi:hypothetical protein